MIYLSQLGGSWHCWGVDCFDRSLVPFMNGQAWVYPPWKIHIFSWKSMVKRWNLLLGWHIFKGYVSFRECIFWWQLGYLDGNCVSTGFNGLPFSSLKEAFLFFHHLRLPKKQLWRACQRQVQKNERILYLLLFFFDIDTVDGWKKSDIRPLTWGIKPCKLWNKLPRVVRGSAMKV